MLGPVAAEIATKPYTGEPVWELYAKHFGTPAFMDQPVSLAFAGESVLNWRLFAVCWPGRAALAQTCFLKQSAVHKLIETDSILSIHSKYDSESGALVHVVSAGCDTGP